MLRRVMPALLAGLLLASFASAQPLRFRWQTGQTLTYRVEQSTVVSEEVGETKTVSKSKLSLVKRWQVQQVDADGAATVQLSLAALRLETTLASGETLLFDSANLDKSHAQMREQMQKYVGAPLATLRIDGRGQVLEVKDSKFGPASRYQNELPFALVLPEKAIEAGQSWERAYQIVLDPPNGTGEKFDAVQQYTLTKGPAPAIRVTTSLKSKPDSAADEAALSQFLPSGEVVFDAQTGALRSAKMSIDREVAGQQGAGSKYRFQSTYHEELATNP